MKLTQELIDDYLAGSLGKTQAAALEAWLKSHPADAAKVETARALSAALAASAPVLSEARSKQMWANIAARVGAADPAALNASRDKAPVIVLGGDPWYAFLFRPWAGAGFATAAVALAVLVWRPWMNAPAAAPGSGSAVPVAAAPADLDQASKEAVPLAQAKPVAGAGAGVAAKEDRAEEEAAPAAMAELASAAPLRAKKAAAPLAAPAPAAAMLASAPAGAPAAADAKAAEPTEVERALADGGVDGMIDAYLAAQKQQRANGAMAAMDRRSGPSFGQGNASPLAGYTETVEKDDSLDSASLSSAQGGQDNNGFWNWTPAAVALNHHDWPQARVELDAARSKAAEASERAFAASALTLLSAPGAPLAGQGEALPSLGELRVLGAGRWQLLVDSRLARFSQGVSVRLPGFRADGDSLLLDLTFDRGTFAPGTHFTRLAGEAPAEVQDAQGQAFSADEFNAPAGATYNISGRQLKLR